MDMVEEERNSLLYKGNEKAVRKSYIEA